DNEDQWLRWPRRRVELSRIAFAAPEASGAGALGAGVLPLPGLASSPSRAGRSMIVDPVGMPSLSIGLGEVVSPDSPTSRSKAAADSSSTDSDTCGLTVAAAALPATTPVSTRTRNDSGPISK